MALRYSPEEARQFADALAQVPLLEDPAGRDRVIEELETAAGQPLGLARHPTARGDLFGLAEACLSRPELTLLLLTVLTVVLQVPSSPAMLTLARLADRLVPPTALTFAERQELLSFVSGTGEELVPVVHGGGRTPSDRRRPSPATWGRSFTTSKTRCRSRTACLRCCFLPNCWPGRLTSAAGALRAWTERVSDRLGLSRELAAARQTLQPPAVPEQRYLTVELTPDPISADQFRLRAWLQDSSGRPAGPVQLAGPAGPVVRNRRPGSGPAQAGRDRRGARPDGRVHHSARAP